MSLSLTDVRGIGPSTAQTLIDNNIDSVKKLAKIDLNELTSVPGIGDTTGQNMIQAARDLHAANKPAGKDKKKGGKNKKGKKGKNKSKNKGKKNKK